MGGEARSGHTADMAQRLVDVHRAPFHRALAEHVHPLHEVADAVHLVLDQRAELAVAFLRRLFQQLGGAADAGKRVLHLMRQHRRHGRGAARRAAEVELPVELLRRGAVLERQHHRAGQFRQRRAMGGHVRPVQAGAFQDQVVVGDRRLRDPYLPEQREEAAVRRQQVVQRELRQRDRGQVEEELRRRVGEMETVRLVQHHDRHRDRRQDGGAFRRQHALSGPGRDPAYQGTDGSAHAAIASARPCWMVTPLSISGSQKRRISSSAASTVSARFTRPRNSALPGRP